MNRWRGKVAVVTGASAGIGLATVKSLVESGLIVVGLARRKEKMEDEMSGFSGSGKFHAVKCDVTKESEVNDVFDWIKENLGRVDILVNNAGSFRATSLIDGSSEDALEIMNLNVMGVIYCTKRAVSLMKEKDEEAVLININSILGHKIFNIPGRHYGLYPATKFAVTALSQIYKNELRGTKIRVTSLSPGYVATEILKAANVDGPLPHDYPALMSQDVADSILHVIRAPPHVNITELTIQPLGEMF